ncbi:DUF438 domain-containing protein [Geomonas sp. Red32]|uniref:DUF438 domain-containing protein n=1 Tax=Geomonas sp. Red32 TaxID=2912856 RepID=UPI00202D0D91|nr:DUF438 domain-containing protein [Geomonas sp. Red32]MCM0082955.1 DUF438 domain-containing protein [Geomonas sp. Red32]
MEISAKTKLDDLFQAYPFLLDFFINRSPKFKMLKSAVMRRTVGKVAPLSYVAERGEIPVGQLLSEIAAEVRAKSGDVLVIAAGEGGAEAPVLDDQARHEVLKGIIRDLHAGVEMAALKHRFHALIRDVEPTEIARMEQRLIAEGMPETEIKRLCDVHVELFKDSLVTQERPATPEGHPVHTFMAENAAAQRITGDLDLLLARLDGTQDGERFAGVQPGLTALLDNLSSINLHYLRKENQLFPVLEQHDINGPTEVMWAIHDDIRQTIKQARAEIAGAQLPQLYRTVQTLVQSVNDMIFKEEHILFPMALEILPEEDWAKVRLGEEEIGYAWIEAPAGGNAEAAGTGVESAKKGGEIDLDTGRMTPELVNLVLTHLPVDISFVNERDEVLYYSQTKDRIFPRSPGVIGRNVEKCHPPKSLHMVQRILSDFRAGTKDEAEFWIQMAGKFIHIRYFAVRDANGEYKGTLEVSQDVTGIRKLEGEQRLLDWE